MRGVRKVTSGTGDVNPTTLVSISRAGRVVPLLPWLLSLADLEALPGLREEYPVVVDAGWMATMAACARPADEDGSCDGWPSDSYDVGVLSTGWIGPGGALSRGSTWGAGAHGDGVFWVAGAAGVFLSCGDVLFGP